MVSLVGDCVFYHIVLHRLFSLDSNRLSPLGFGGALVFPESHLVAVAHCQVMGWQFLAIRQLFRYNKGTRKEGGDLFAIR